MKKPASAFVLLPILGFSILALAQGATEDVISVPKLVTVCESCHGPGGVSRREDVPSLAGQSVDAILDSLDAFYFHRRHCPETSPGDGDEASAATLDMCNISASLSQVEKVALAEHFSVQPTPGN